MSTLGFASDLPSQRSSRNSHRRCSVKKVFLEISQNSRESTSARASFLIKACNFIKKETLAQVFPCEFCEISMNVFFQNTSGRLLPVPHKLSINNVNMNNQFTKELCQNIRRQGAF